MVFCIEDSDNGYLGVHIDCCKDLTIYLTQKGLLHWIIKAMHLAEFIVDTFDTPCT